MSNTIMDIEGSIDRIEALIKDLRGERDGARQEAAALKLALDERELELLQSDDELQQTKRLCQEQIELLAEERRVKEETESRLSEIASRVKSLLPLVTDGPNGDARNSERPQ